MNRRKWLWAAVLAVPAVIAGGVAYARSNAGYVCPITGEVLPCSRCCPLNDKGQAKEEGYTCTVTGEELPCPKCCPLNQDK